MNGVEQMQCPNCGKDLGVNVTVGNGTNVNTGDSVTADEMNAMLRNASKCPHCGCHLSYTVFGGGGSSGEGTGRTRGVGISSVGGVFATSGSGGAGGSGGATVLLREKRLLRAVHLIKNEWGKTDAEVLAWLDDDALWSDPGFADRADDPAAHLVGKV